MWKVNMASSPGSDLNGLFLLLLGGKQSGKSSAGNAILGRVAFQKKTTRSRRESGTVFGSQVVVVDTPGWLSQSETPSKISKEIQRGLTLCGSGGPHAVLLVLPLSRNIEPEQLSAMEIQIRQLEASVWQKILILFTHGDQLERFSVQDYVRQQGAGLRWLLDRCGNRFQVFGVFSAAMRDQVAELLQKIHGMVGTWRRRGLEVEQRWQQTPSERRGTAWNPGVGLILLGRRRSGKSSAGNAILGKKQFPIDVKTSRCSAGQAEISGRTVTVVDTPGWSLFGLAKPETVRQEIQRSPSLCQLRSRKAFLLTVPVDSFSEKQRRATETYLSVLDEQVWRSTVVLFTYGEELKGRTVEKFMEKEGEALQWLLDRCAHRFLVSDSKKRDEVQINQLLEMVENL